MIDEALLEDEAVFRVGTVASVDGRKLRIAVDKLKNGSHLLYKGGLVRNVAVGSYVKITKGFFEMIAKIDGEHVREDRAARSDYRRPVDTLARVLDASLVGFLSNGHFERGIRELPLLDNECFTLTAAEFDAVHRFAGPDIPAITIGSLATEPTQAVALAVDQIFASHVGIFGNTGSGKSYTLAKLYHSLFERYGTTEAFRTTAQFVLIDFNGEYVDLAGDPGDYATAVIAGSPLKKSYRLSTRTANGDRLPLPLQTIEDDTFWTVLLDATEKTQAPFLARVLKSDYLAALVSKPDDLLHVIADLVVRATKSSDPGMDRQTCVNFLDEIQECLGNAAPPELGLLIAEFRAHLQYHGNRSTHFWTTPLGSTVWANTDAWRPFIETKIKALQLDTTSITAIDLVRFKIVLQYYRDIISGFANREHLGPLIKRLHSRIPNIKALIDISNDDVVEAPLTVVSLRDVNLAMRKVVPMLLCKQLYERRKRGEASGSRYLNLIIDEAHNILSTESSRESEAWRDYRLETFEEIIKEGRKFNVFLTIASQRPHDISETIISQLHNYFLHRLVNNLDIHAVSKAVSYLDAVSYESLPILPTGTCVIAGISAQVPVIAKVSALPDAAAPNNQTLSVADVWTGVPVDESDSHTADRARAEANGLAVVTSSDASPE